MGLIAILLALALLILLAVFGPGDFNRRRDIAMRVLSTLCAVFVLLLAGCDQHPPRMTPQEVADGTRACHAAGWNATLHTHSGYIQHVRCTGPYRR